MYVEARRLKNGIRGDECRHKRESILYVNVMGIIPGASVWIICGSVGPMGIFSFFFFPGNPFVSYVECVGVKPSVGMETVMHFCRAFCGYFLCWVLLVYFDWCGDVRAQLCLYSDLFMYWGVGDATISPSCLRMPAADVGDTGLTEFLPVKMIPDTVKHQCLSRYLQSICHIVVASTGVRDQYFVLCGRPSLR